MSDRKNSSNDSNDGDEHAKARRGMQDNSYRRSGCPSAAGWTSIPSCDSLLIFVQWKDEIDTKSNGLFDAHIHHGKDKLKVGRLCLREKTAFSLIQCADHFPGQIERCNTFPFAAQFHLFTFFPKVIITSYQTYCQDFGIPPGVAPEDEQEWLSENGCVMLGILKCTIKLMVWAVASSRKSSFIGWLPTRPTLYEIGISNNVQHYILLTS